MVLPDSFFSDRTVSQILGELMDIRRDCQSWLAVGEAHYHDRKGKAQSINKAPEWLIPVYHPQRGTINCYKDCLNISKLYEAGWTYIDGKLIVGVYSTVDLCRGYPVDISLLEKYLPPLQKYGVPMMIFPFKREIILQEKILSETESAYGTKIQLVDVAQAQDMIPRAWYDRDYKVLIKYSALLVTL